MTVKELMEKLKEFDENVDVQVAGGQFRGDWRDAEVVYYSRRSLTPVVVISDYRRD